MRRVIIGDVHGCFKQLDALLKKVNLDKEKDELIFLGDYTDRGPDSYKVWKLLQTLHAEMGERLTLIRGNHEELAVTYARTKKQDDFALWKLNGCKQTVSSFKKAGFTKKETEEQIESYAEFIKKHAVYFYECEEFLAAHAGIKEGEHPSVTMQRDPDHLIWDRSTFTFGSYYGKLAFIGHTPVENPVYVLRDLNGGISSSIVYDKEGTYSCPKKGLLCIDTGCFKTKVLTAAAVENGQITFYHT